MNNLAYAYQDAGRMADALRLQEETCRLMSAKMGPDHVSTLVSLESLAKFYHAQGQAAKGLPLLEDVVRRRSANWGPEDPGTLQAMTNLALIYLDAGRVTEAVSLNEQALRLYKETLGPEDPRTLSSMHILATCYERADRLPESIALYEETLRLRQAKLGPEHPSTLATMHNLATNYLNAGRYEDALPLLESTLRLQRQVLGAEHRQTLITMRDYVDACREVGRQDEAMRLAPQLLEVTQKALPPGDAQILSARPRWPPSTAMAVERRKRSRCWRQRSGDGGNLRGPQHPQTLSAQYFLAVACSRAGQVERTIALLEETVRGRQQALGMTHGDTLEALLLLGNLHVERSEFTAAEPLLLEAYEGFAKRQAAGATPYEKRTLREALVKLVQLYEKSTQPGKAKQWQEKLNNIEHSAKSEETTEN